MKYSNLEFDSKKIIPLKSPLSSTRTFTYSNMIFHHYMQILKPIRSLIWEAFKFRKKVRFRGVLALNIKAR